MSDEGAGRIPERPRAVIFGCAGESLTAAEKDFFAAANPLGFILFGRNCRDPAQVRELVAAFRDSVERPDAPVLIDQEGGRVARLRPPHWRAYPPPGRIATLADPQAEEAAGLQARLIADDLAALGITVDCAPVLDLPAADSDPIIGDRAYGNEPGRAARLARAACAGFLAGGVLPVIKHMPGHGRARVDSHKSLPLVDASRAELAAHDFVPFRELAAMPWGMTAHVVFTAIDPDAPGTLSPTIIGEVIRGEIGFGGLLLSDDISMGALTGTIGERVRRALDAGCDVASHCNGDPAEMNEIAQAARSLSSEAAARLARGEALRRQSRQPFDRAAAEARFDALMAGGA